MVDVFLPGETELCYLGNAAQIVWPLGWGDANPADDFDFSSALVPNQRCEPPRGDTTNLRIEKEGLRVCLDREDTWFCAYRVTVTNTGPGVYTGNIVVSDVLSVAMPIVSAPPPWICTNPGPVHDCTFPSASLPDGPGGGFLNPGNSVVLLIGVNVPKGLLVQDGKCSVTNQARITFAPGGSPMNVNPGDDVSALVESATPGRNCEPLGRPSDLTIIKEGVDCRPYEQPSRALTAVIPNQGGGWACFFTIRLHNNGPDDFVGPVTVKDTFVGFTPLPPSPVFGPPVCAPDGGGGYDCSGPVAIANGATSPPLVVGVLVPDDGETCDITNRAAIVTPPGGDPHNVNGGNDTADATLHIPSEKCAPHLLKKENVCPLDRRMPNGGCCPDGRKVDRQGVLRWIAEHAAQTMPEGHHRHAAELPAEWLSRGDARHAAELQAECLPGGDARHAAELRAECLPGGNPWHATELPAQFVPGGDARHAAELQAERLPGRLGRHAAELLPARAEPPGHRRTVIRFSKIVRRGRTARRRTASGTSVPPAPSAPRRTARRCSSIARRARRATTRTAGRSVRPVRPAPRANIRTAARCRSRRARRATWGRRRTAS